MRLHDVSVALGTRLPIWPGSAGFSVRREFSIENGDPANVSVIEMDVHTGTHIDAPLHFMESGGDVESIALDLFVGPVTLRSVEDTSEIHAGDLERAGIPLDCRRLLIKTGNSDLWAEDIVDFQEDFAALSESAAQWIVKRGIEVVGIDYLSIQRFHDGPEVHEILLEAGVMIIEGLRLDDVDPGPYELICLPLRLVGCEGAPARVLLRSDS